MNCLVPSLLATLEKHIFLIFENDEPLSDKINGNIFLNSSTFRLSSNLSKYLTALLAYYFWP